MKSNKKGFSLIYAIMVSVVLSIIAVGFLSLVDFSTKTTKNNYNKLDVYWASESASNYNVNWWVNLERTERVDWNESFKNGQSVDETIFPCGEGLTKDGKFYLYSVSSDDNPELLIGNKQLVNVRYVGERKDKEGYSIWVLDSYAWDKETKQMCNIIISKVYNYALNQDNLPFHNSELINATLANAGFHGCKGRFNEQDIRYGQCYFGGLIHLDYKTGADKVGAVFYGLVQSSAWTTMGEMGFNPISWYASENKRFNDINGVYYTGLGLNSSKIKNENTANEWASNTLKGGYDKNAQPINTDIVTWKWDTIEQDGDKYGLYFLDENKFTSGENIKVVLISDADETGNIATKANIYGGSTLKETITIGKPPIKYTGIAVKEKYGVVGIQGVSNEDFSLITQKDQVQILDNFYLYGAEDIYQTMLSWGYFTQQNPSEQNLKILWELMNGENVKGHLAVIAGLDLTLEESGKTAPIYIPTEKLIFSTASYISQFGELNAKGVGNSDLNFYNIGSIMTLEKQNILTGASDTAQQWKKIYIQDQRYLREDEPLPPFCGEDPGILVDESISGLNPRSVWFVRHMGTVIDWKSKFYR
jgi:hypothetical protein